MDARLWRRVNEILDEAEQLPPEERDAFVRRACEGDRELAREVEAILSGMPDCPDDFLGSASGTTEPAAPLLPSVVRGDEVIGDFELLRKLGGGSAGTVYEAVQNRFGRKVALKIVHVRSVDDYKRVRREALTAGQLDHPGLATVHDFGREGEVYWIAMELIRGHDLGVEIGWQTDGALGDAEPLLPGTGEPDFVSSRVSLVREVALALHAAHAAGIVHRDVKPANIVLTREGRPKLVDFGLARGPRSVAATLPGAIVGTVPYMSHEQAHGRTLDARTDVYSLGAVLFQLLTGRLPFPGTNRDVVLDAIRSGRIPTLREIDRAFSKDLEAVCARAMEPDRDRRYASAREFADDLERCLACRAVRARHATPLYRAEQWVRRHRRRLVAAAAVVVAAGALAIVAATSGFRSGSDTALLDGLNAARATVDAYDGGDVDIVELVPAARMALELENHSDRRVAGAARDLERRLDAIGAQEIERADASIEAARGDAPHGPIDERGLLVALQDRRLARALTSARAGAADLDAEFPRLTVRSDRPGDRVRVFALDVLSGTASAEPVAETTTPAIDLAVAPGHYRVVVERPGHGSAELTRSFVEWGRAYDLGRVEVVADDVALREMVELTASEQTLVLPVFVDGDFIRRTFRHDPFLLDAYEVTNAEYLEFVQARGAELAPPAWSPAPTDDEWNERPVAGVSWVQARAYAEWRGKRLPTELEWERAVRGVEGRAYPWGDDEEAIGQLAVACATPAPGTASAEAMQALYMQHARRVGTTPADVTPEGVYDLAGNVSEWTESIALGEIDGRLHPLVTRRRSKGWNWGARHPYELSSYEEEQMTAPFFTPVRGFRCAKSARR